MKRRTKIVIAFFVRRSVRARCFVASLAASSVGRSVLLAPSPSRALSVSPGVVGSVVPIWRLGGGWGAAIDPAGSRMLRIAWKSKGAGKRSARRTNVKQ